MQYHPLSTMIIELLVKGGYWHETFEHEPVTTSEEAAKIRPGYTLEQGAKAIIMKGGEDQYVMLVMPANLRIDSKKVKKVLNTRSVRFATEEEINTLSPGLQRGGVPPFGNLIGLPVYCDPSLLENEKIVFNAGDRRFSVAMNSKDYVVLVHPAVCSFVEQT